MPRAHRMKDEEAVPHGEIDRAVSEGVVNRLKLWANTGKHCPPALLRCLQMELFKQQCGGRSIALGKILNGLRPVLFREEEVVLFGDSQGTGWAL